MNTIELLYSKEYLEKNLSQLSSLLQEDNIFRILSGHNLDNIEAITLSLQLIMRELDKYNLSSTPALVQVRSIEPRSSDQGQ